MGGAFCAATVLEGMATGLPVIGALTGGTGEILVEGETGLTFAAGDSEGLARQIRRLAEEPRCAAGSRPTGVRL